MASALAMPTRCCSPPDSSCGRLRPLPSSPTRASSAFTRRSLAADSSLDSRIGTPTFSAADSIGSRANDWKTSATRSRRSLSCSSRVIAVTS